MLKKIYRDTSVAVWDIMDKEIIDETIFRTTKLRNRLILELMARGGMRIGEVLNLKPMDVNERKLIIRDPKSGREHEVVFIPKKSQTGSRAISGKRGLNLTNIYFRSVMKQPG